jgi:hypothetical protein
VKAPKAPLPPDPVATAQAQTQMNKETAITQGQMNMVDQSTPYGSLSYTQTGSWADGTPKYSASQTLSPEQQALLGQQNEFDRKFNEIGLAQTDKIGGILSKPLDLSNEATEARLMELGRKRLDPMIAQQTNDLRTTLINQGLRPGTEAWDREMTRNDQSRNDAFNQLLLSGRGQAVQEALTERSAPINEITALLNGGQVQNPNFVNTPQTQVANTDYGGMVYNSANLANQNYQQKVGQQNSMLGGLASIAGTALGGWMKSDRRIKTDIRRVGTLDNGLPVYAYRFKSGGPVEIGVMAQEVERVRPEAVREFDGIKHVNYARAVEAV